MRFIRLLGKDRTRVNNVTIWRWDEAFIALLSSVAQGESENKSEAIKWSLKRRFANGLPLCPTWALLGYTTDEYGNMVVVASEAETVTFIYESYLEGWSTTEIAAKLTESGTPTVKGLDEWPVGSVYCILRNEKYCGDVLMQIFCSVMIKCTPLNRQGVHNL